MPLVGFRGWLLGAAALTSVAAAAAPTPTSLQGAYRSNCVARPLDGASMFSRLSLRFAPGKPGSATYTSEEILYSDSLCEISVLSTATSGKWKTEKAKLLTLRPKRIQLMPLDPRVADSMDARRACGKRWQNAEANEVANTPCGKEKTAQYFLGGNRHTEIHLYECEGKNRIDAECIHYSMNHPSVKIAKAVKSKHRRRL